MSSKLSCFISFDRDLGDIQFPESFTFPFYYQPHKLSVIASEQLQKSLESRNWKHNFGLTPDQDGLVIGKMFGVLVVKSKNGEMGFLAGFSGKIADENHHNGFVPPVYDILEKDGFFREEEGKINELNAEIERLSNQPARHESADTLSRGKKACEVELNAFRADIKQGKKERKKQREDARETLSDVAYQKLDSELSKLSVNHQIAYKRLAKRWRERIGELQKLSNQFTDRLELLKAERKNKSGELQKRLFDEYKFLNTQGDWRSLLSIFHFTETQTPPAGAGECAAPKLLQYAYLHDLEPIAIAEFWWGASPKSDVRKHKQFYPACKSKCEPILGHMLKGLEVDPNPMLENPDKEQVIEILFEDEHLVAINKPAEFLSVPGKTILDSIYSRMKKQYPDATGPLIVHRLDMSTSGIMLIAKTKETHKKLQHQFEKRTIKKRYVALLDGELDAQEGEIELPLRVDLDDRPRQLVCYEYGKPSRTKWELIEVKDGRSLVYFYPQTGRTHQLRVHAAHTSGLNIPIVGDDLYGNQDSRLHLHAEQLQFTHPITRKILTIKSKVPF
jgi:tRNA pseudouridine32 synthase/23S rRNA pseudouridine746 synthase